MLALTGEDRGDVWVRQPRRDVGLAEEPVGVHWRWAPRCAGLGATTRAAPFVLASLSILLAAHTALAQQGGAASAPPVDSSITAVGDVVSAEGPVAYATVTIEPGKHSRFADAGGSFAIGHLTARLYRVRVRQIGFAPVDTLVQLGLPGPVVRMRITLKRIAVKLPAISILAKQECLVTGIPDSSVDADLAALFGELRKNIDRYRSAGDGIPVHFCA